MSYSNHHSTATHAGHTRPGRAVLSLNEQQQAFRAELVSVVTMENQMTNDNDSVEKSGTGIVQAKAGAGEAGLNSRVDSVERIVDCNKQVAQSFELYLPHCGFA